MICAWHKYEVMKKSLSVKNKYYDFLTSLPLNENIKDVEKII